MISLSWMRDLPIDLYPSAPPLVQIRGISQHKDPYVVVAFQRKESRLYNDEEDKEGRSPHGGILTLS